LKTLLSLLPVLLFLVSLYLLDSFKLVRGKLIIACLAWGILAAGISYYVNTFLIDAFNPSQTSFTRYFAPVTEEILKISMIILVISRKKAGFVVDAAIYGFASGTGFALAENLFYLFSLESETTLMVWMLRGFGTAVMHGGCTSIAAMIIMGSLMRDRSLGFSLPLALLSGIILHSTFNHFLVHPILQTAFIFLLLPLAYAMVFRSGNQLLQNWLEIGFSNEVEMLGMIRKGKFSSTKAGEYLISLKKYFNPSMIVDLYCYLSLYLELSIKAKRNLMLRESGLPVVTEEGLQEKLAEWLQLRKQIGKTGEMALQPLLRMSQRDIWNLNQLR
jgi:protease PrsW